MLYDIDLRRQLAREHTDNPAHEMRRARGLTRAEAGYPNWGRVAAELLGRAERLRRGKGYNAPAYDA